MAHSIWSLEPFEDGPDFCFKSSQPVKLAVLCSTYYNSKDLIFNVSLSIQNVIIAGTSKASSVEQDRIVGVEAKPLLLTFLITMRILTP